VLQAQHDAGFAPLLRTLSQHLNSGDQQSFLLPFSATLSSTIGHWFSNTRALGVAATLFAQSDNYSSVATDSATSFTRTVVLGIRTPYDDDNSMPGIAYSVGISVTHTLSRDVLQITRWQPKFLDDPMFCTCTMTVVHTLSTAVVVDSTDPDLLFWSKSALAAAAGGIAWSHLQLAGTSLVPTKGQVIFLADRPFRWFVSLTGAAQLGNLTTPLNDALGAYPGTRYSDQSRIVVMLMASDGSVVPNNVQGRQYVTDVITHESTHQLMNRNAVLRIRSDGSPPIWAVEGIAVAVETLYRASLSDDGNQGYVEPNDPKNIDQDWYRTHLTDQMPTRNQLYNSSGVDTAGYYAISGSVFRYIERDYGYIAMMTLAKALYAKPAQDPFALFPDPEHPGANLVATTAKDRWKAWFTTTYVS